MAFKMRSGNKTVFKKMGSSPVKQEKPIPYPETIIGEITIHGKKKQKPKPKLGAKPTKPTKEEKPIYKDPIVPSEINQQKLRKKIGRYQKH